MNLRRQDMTTTYNVTFEVDSELLLTDTNGEEVDGVSALNLLLRERLYDKEGSVTGWICDMTKISSVTLPDLGKVWALYQEMIDHDVIEDRREYSEQDLVHAYSTTPEETDYLMRLIMSEFAPCTAALYRSYWNFRFAYFGFKFFLCPCDSFFNCFFFFQKCIRNFF